jgi:purine nucleosidase
LLRNLWFWIAIGLIAIGVFLTIVLDVFYWLLAAFIAACIILIAVFLSAAYNVGRAEAPQLPALKQASREERIPLIYDCDVTMGLPFRDVCDGMALCYVLGEPRLDLHLITTTYGNSAVRWTTRTARRLLQALHQDDVPVIPGASNPAEAAESNEAARHLQEIVDTHRNRITLIATGSLTNLRHAVALDEHFFKKLDALYLFGGLTRRLLWNERLLDERNFSLDPEAAYLAIHADCPVTMVTGRVGLTAIFRSPQYAQLQALDDPVSQLIARKMRFWFALMRLWFHDDGFGLWDALPTLSLTHPDLFEAQQVYVTSTRDDLARGRLYVDPSQYGPITLVTGVRDFDQLMMAQFAAWRRLGESVSAERARASQERNAKL